MIISKKKYDEAIKEAQDKVFEKIHMDEAQRDSERWMNERIDNLSRRIDIMENELRNLKRIKDTCCDTIKAIEK